MIQFWIEKRNRNWLQITGGLVVISFLFTTISAPFAQSSLWSERKKAVEELRPREIGGARGSRGSSTPQNKSSQPQLELASIAGLSLPAQSLPSFRNQLSPEALQQVLTKIQTQPKFSTNKNSLGIPPEFLSHIESYGDIERIYLAKGNHLRFVEGKLKSGAGPLVFLIQDAHGIYSVQKNIALLLKELTAKGAGWVGVEGAEGRIRGLDQYRNYPNKETLNGMAGYLLKEGLLTGVEVAALSASHGSNADYYGVEEKEKYEEQIKSFKDTLESDKVVHGWLLAAETEIKELKEKIYTTELKDLDSKKDKYEQGELKLGEWLDQLVSVRIEGSEKQINLRNYLAAYRLEKTIDFKKVEIDQKKLLEALSSRLSKDELIALLEESIAYRFGKIGYQEFYKGLKHRCEKAGISLTPEMKNYINYISLVEGIAQEKLFEESKELEKKVYVELTRGDEKAEKLYQRDKNYRLLVKAVDFRLSVDEWDEYQKNKEEIAALSPESLKGVLKNVNRFNQLSHERNHIFVEKLMKRQEVFYSRFREAPSSTQTSGTQLFNYSGKESSSSWLSAPISVLVAGGYHSKGIEEILKKKGISFITIRPQMNSEELGRNGNKSERAVRGKVGGGYHPLNAFKRELLPLEKMFLPEKVTLAPRLAMVNTDSVQGRAVQGILNATPVVDTLQGKGGQRAVIKDEKWISKNVFTGVVGSIRVEVSKSKEGADLKSDLEDVGLDTKDFQYGQTNPIGTNEDIIDIATRMEKPSALARAAVLTKPIQQKSQKSASLIFANLRRIKVLISRQLKRAVNAPATIFLTLKEGDSGIPLEGDSQFLTGGESQSEISDASMEGAVSAESSARALKTCRSRIDAIFNVLLTAVNNYIRLKHTETETSADLLTARNRMVWALQTYLDLMREFSLSVKDSRIGILDFVRNYLKVELYLMGGWKRSYQIDPEVYELLADSTPQALRDPALLNGMISKLILQPLTIFMRNKIKEDQMRDRGVIHISVLSGWELQFEYMPIRLDGSSPTVEIRKRYEEIVQAVFAHVDQIVDSKAKAADPKVLKKLVRGQDDFEVEEQESPSAQRPTAKYPNNQIFGIKLSKAVVDQSQEGRWAVLGRRGDHLGEFNTPKGIAVSKPYLWVVDRWNHRIQVYNYKTEQWGSWGTKGDKPGELDGPTGIAFDASGKILVADTENHRIQVCDPKTNQWIVMGKYGSGLGEFKFPSAVAVDKEGRIWVADKMNHRIQSYDPKDGWKSYGKKGRMLGELDGPSDIAVDKDGNVWVADSDNHRIQTFHPSTGEWTSIGRFGGRLGELRNPSGIAFDSKGILWIADNRNDRLQTYSTDTKIWESFGRRGNRPGEFRGPDHIAINHNDIVYVTDVGNHRVQIFSGGRRSFPSRAEASVQIPVQVSALAQSPAAAVSASVPPPAPAVQVLSAESVSTDQETTDHKSKLGMLRPKESPQELLARLRQILSGYERSDGVYPHKEVITDENIRIAEKSEGEFELEYQGRAYSLPQIAKLSEAGFISFYDFLKVLPSMRQGKPPLIFVDSDEAKKSKGLTAALSAFVHITPFPPYVWDFLGVQPPKGRGGIRVTENHVRESLDFLTSDQGIGESRPIVFFFSQWYRDHALWVSQWVKDHPEMGKNIFYVVGGYELDQFFEQNLFNYSVTHDDKQKQKTDIFRAIIKGIMEQGNSKAWREDNKSLWNSFAVGSILSLVAVLAVHFGVPHTGNFPEILAFFLAGGFHFRQSVAILIAAIRAGLNKGPTGKRTINKSKIILKFSSLPKAQRKLKSFFTPCKVMHGKIYFNPRLMKFISPEMQELFYQHEKNHIAFELAHPKLSKVPGVEEFFVSVKEFQLAFSREQTRAELFKDLPFLILLFSIGAASLHLNVLLSSILQAVSNTSEEFRRGMVPVIVAAIVVLPRFVRFVNHKVRFERGMLEVKRLIRDKRFLDAHTLPNKFRANARYLKELYRLSKIYSDVGSGLRPEESKMEFSEQSKESFERAIQLAKIYLRKNNPGKESYFIREKLFKFLVDSLISSDMISLVLREVSNEPLQDQFESYAVIGSRRYHLKKDPEVTRMIFKTALRKALTTTEINPYLLILERMYSSGNNSPENKSECFTYFKKLIDQIDIPDDNIIKAACLYDIGDYKGAIVGFAMAEKLAVEILDPMERSRYYDLLAGTMFKFSSPEEVYYTRTSAGKTEVEVVRNSGQYFRSQAGRVSSLRSPEYIEKTSSPFYEYMQETVKPKPNSGKKKSLPFGLTAPSLVSFSFLLTGAAKGNPTAFLDFVTGPLLSVFVVAFLALKLFGQILLVMKKEEAVEADKIKFKRNRYSMVAGLVLGLVLIFTNIAKANSYIPLESDPAKKGRILWSFEVHIPEFSKQFINVLEELRRDHKRVYAFNEMAPPNLNWVRFLDPSLASKIERSSNLDDPDLKNELDIFLRNIYWKATSVAGIVKNIQDQVPGIDLNRIAEQDPLLLYLAEHPEIIPINEHAAVETAISQLKADAALENARQQLYDLRNKELFLKEMQKHRDATYQMHLARDRTDAKLLSALIKYNPFSGIGVRRGFYHRDIYKSVDAGDRSQDIFLPALSLSLDRNAELYRQNIKRGLKTISSLTRKDYLLEFPSESVKFYFKPTGANVQFFDKVFGKLSESDLERLTNDIQKQSSLFYADVNKKDISAWMNRLGMFTILWLKENGFISAQEFSQLEFESANSRAYVLSASISDFIQSLRQQRLSYDHNLQDKTMKFFSLASKIAAITGGTALILLGDLAGPQTAHAAGILGIVNPMVGAGMFIGIGILALFFIVQLIGDRGAAKDFQYGQTNPVKEQAGKIVKFMRRNSMRNPTASTFLHYSLKPVLYAELRKGGAISQTTRKMALSHMGGAANSGMLETGISQIQTASALGTRIFLFGMRHSSSYDNLLEKKLAELAIQGKIVLGIEGIPLDNISILRERIRQRYGVEETDFIYGFEDEFVDDFSNLVDYLIQFFEFKKFSISKMLTRLLYRMELFHRRFFGKPLIPEEILFHIQRSVFAPADIIGRLTESAAGDWMLWRFWKQLGAKPLSKRGRQYYNSITEPLLKLENIRKDGGNPRSYEIAIPIPPLKADAWLELTRILALIMAEKAQEFPDDLRPNLDEIKRLVDNPYNPSDLDVDPEKLGANKIFLSLIIDWRNRFIFKRMLQIVDIAIAKNLDTYFTIGRLHISEIAELFMNSPYRDRVRGVYGSTDLIPPEILPEGVFLPEDQPSTGASLPDVTTNLVERKEDNKSLWNSLTIGSILGLSAVAAVHFGVPHTGHIPEMIAFFLVGGFHLTQALMILIAAIRAGLSRGSPYNPEKLIPEFRNLPIEQKNLQSRFTPCQFKNGEILVNPRLMQYIPKGMQRIFYRHEQNHQRHSQFVEKLFFSSQKTIFQQTYLRLSKVPLVEEFIVSLMDFGYFGFLFRENFWKKVALTPVFAVLGMSGVGHGPSASAGARIHFISDDHHTRANYHERLKTLVQSADVMFIEEANKWNDYYNQISQGSLTPQEFIDLVHGQGESFEFEEGVMALFNAIYGSGKKIVGAQVPEESDQMLAELDLLYDRSQKALISGKSFQAVDAYQSLLRLTGKFVAMKDRILIAQLQQQIKQGPFINYLVVRGHVHSYPYLVLKQNRSDLLITREFFTPTGRMAEEVTLDTMLKEEAAMQAAGVQPFRRFSESELVTAMVSLMLLNIASEADKARSDVLTLNRIAHRVRSMKKFEGLTQIMRDRPVQNDTDFRVNLIDWIIKYGFAIQEDLMKALGVIQEIQQSPESSGGIASSSTPDREILAQTDDTSNRGSASAEVMNRNQGAPSSPLTFLSYIAIHKEFMWKLWEKVEKDFPDLVLIGYDFTIKFKETFDSVVRRNCRMHIELERPNSYWLDLAAMYVSEYIYKKKLRGPAPWTYGKDVLIEFSLESLILQMNNEIGIKSVNDYIKEQYGREAAESVGNELISDCLIFFARNIRRAYEQDYRGPWGSEEGRAEDAARSQIGQAQQWFWMLHNLLKMRLEYLRPYLDSQDDFVRQISKATLKEFDREQPEIAMDPLIFQRPIRDESTGVSYSLDLYRQFITEMLRDTLLARFAYKFPDLSRDQLLRIYDAVLSDELEEHSRIMNEDSTQDEVEEDPDIEWVDVPIRPSLTQDQRIYIAMFLRDLAFEYIALHLYNRIIELHHWDGHAMEYAIRNALEELKSEETISRIEKRFNYEAVGYFPILYEKILFPPFVLSYIKRFLKQAATKAIHIHSGGVEEIKPEEFYLWLWFVLHFYWERLLSMQVSELEEAEAATEVTRRFDLEYSNRSADDARDYVAILAERYGLMSPSEFSYVFKEEDMDWWRDQNYPVDRLRLVFNSLKTIRDLAEKTRYKLVDRSGNMTRTVLSWWSAHILMGKKTADQIEAEFLRIAKRQPKNDDHSDSVGGSQPVSSLPSYIAGGISLAVGILALLAHGWILQKFGPLPNIIAIALVAVLFSLNKRFSTKYFRWLPLSLEAVFKSVFVVPSIAGFILMADQGIKIQKALAKANKVRDGPEAPTKAELNHLKRSLEEMFKEGGTRIVLEDEEKVTEDGKRKTVREIAYVNQNNAEEVKDRKIHIDLLAFYYLPAYLRETILRDHEIGHLRGFNEIQAYLNQALQSWSNLKRYSKQTKFWRFLTVAGTIFLFLVTLFAAPIFKRITNPLASIQGIVSLMESSEVEDDFTKKISQTQISMDGWANNILARTDRNLIIFGEAHSSLFTKRFFRSHILPSLQSAGVKYLVLEHIPMDYQHIVDQFNQTGIMSYDFKYLIMLMTRSVGLPGDEILNLLYEARAHQINLIAGGLAIKIGMNINLNTYQGREAMRLGQTGSLIDAVQSIREIDRNSKIAVYCGSAHTDKTSNEVANVIEPSLTIDIFDPFNIEPPLDLKALANEYGVKFRLGHDFLKKMVTTSADRLSLKNKTFAAQTPYQELADWVIYLGESPKIENKFYPKVREIFPTLKISDKGNLEDSEIREVKPKTTASLFLNGLSLYALSFPLTAAQGDSMLGLMILSVVGILAAGVIYNIALSKGWIAKIKSVFEKKSATLELKDGASKIISRRDLLIKGALGVGVIAVAAPLAWNAFQSLKKSKLSDMNKPFQMFYNPQIKDSYAMSSTSLKQTQWNMSFENLFPASLPPVAAMFGGRTNNFLTPLLYRAFHKTIEAQLIINLKTQFKDEPQILELVKNRRALQPFSAIIQLNSVLHMSFLRRSREYQKRVLEDLERVHHTKFGYLFVGTDLAGMYVGSYLYTRLSKLIGEVTKPEELALVVQKLLVEISGKDGFDRVIDHISSKFGGRDIEILKDIIGEYLLNIAFTLGMTQNEIVLQVLPQEGINGVEELLRILRVEFWSLATILDVRLQFLPAYYRDARSQDEANRTIEQFDREKVRNENKKEKPLDLNAYLSFLNEVVAELTARFSLEFKGMPQEAMLSSYRYIISKEVEEQRRALISAQTLDVYQTGSPEERIGVVSGVLETRDFGYLFIGQQLFDRLMDLHHLNQFSFLSAVRLLRDEIKTGKIREEIQEEIERHPMLTSTKPGEEENGIFIFVDFYLKNFEKMIEGDILSLTSSKDEMEFRAMQFYILIWVLSNFFQEKHRFLNSQRAQFGMGPVNNTIEQFCKQAKNVIIRNEDGQSLTEYGIMAGGLAAFFVLVSKLTAGVPGMGELILATLLLLGGVGVIVYGAILPVFKEIFGQKDSGKLKEMEKLEERFNRVKGYLNADETVKAEKELKEIEKLKRSYLSEARVVLSGSMKGDGLNPSMSKGTGFGGRSNKRNRKALNLLAMGVALALVTNPSAAQSKVVEDHLRSVVKNELSVNLPVEPILSSTVGEHSQELWDEGKVELSDKIEMNQEDINEFEETAWKVAVLAKWASSKVEYKGTSSLSNIGEDLPGATKTFDGTALFSNGVSKEIVEGSILNELRRGGEEKIALTSAYGVSKGKMERAIERLIEKEIDKTLIQSARDRIIYLSSSNGKRVRISSVISQLKSLGLGELGIQIITDDPLRLEESLQFNIRVKIYKLMSATMVVEFKTLTDVAEEMKEFRFLRINA